jgi:hypothetical protein
MEKVRLTLNELQVQSFATTEAAGKGQGTVRGHAPTDQVECPTANQLWDTCWDTCADTCNCGGGGGGGDSADCSYYCWSDWCSWDCSWTWYVSRC